MQATIDASVESERDVQAISSARKKFFRAITTCPFVGHETTVALAMAGMFGGANVMFHGPAGTAKSALADWILSWFPDEHTFSAEFNSSTDLDAIIGPIDINALIDGRLEYRLEEGIARSSAPVKFAVFQECANLLGRLSPALFPLLNSAERRIDVGGGKFLPTSIRSVIGTCNDPFPPDMDGAHRAPWADRWPLKIGFSRSPHYPMLAQIAFRRQRPGRPNHESRFTMDEIDECIRSIDSMPWSQSGASIYARFVAHSRMEGASLSSTDRDITYVFPQFLSALSFLSGYSSIHSSTIPALLCLTLSDPTDAIECGAHTDFWARLRKSSEFPDSPIDVFSAHSRAVAGSWDKGEIERTSVAAMIEASDDSYGASVLGRALFARACALGKNLLRG